MDQTLIMMVLRGRGANSCISIVFAGCSTQYHVSGRHTCFLSSYPPTAIWLGVVCSILNLFDQRIAWLRQLNGRTGS